MSQIEKITSSLLNGLSDNNFHFDDLIKILKFYNFQERIKGSHHFFTLLNKNILVNLQRDGKMAKTYQVKQVREIIKNIIQIDKN